MYREELITFISQKIDIDSSKLQELLTWNADQKFGDYSLPCFPLARELKQPPQKIAEKIGKDLSENEKFDIQVVGPYVNFFYKKEVLAQELLSKIYEKKWPSFKRREETIIIDYSSPNIAKPLAFHHIRSTMIGHSLYNIYKYLGYKVIGINHLGDWGTQFGYIIKAFYGLSQEELEALTFEEVSKAYIEMNKRAKEDSQIEKDARELFLKLERGDAKARKIWESAVKSSMKKFNEIYELLGVRFDEIKGESFYETMLPEIIENFLKRGIASESEGAIVVDLKDKGIDVPLIIRKSDGATMYGTRDLAAAIYRYNRYKFSKALYVTDMGQSLHFKQVFEALKKFGYQWAENLIHVPFGVLLLWDEESKEWTKGRTRTGKVILLKEVIEEAILRIKNIMKDRPFSKEEIEEISRIVGTGAIIFNDLKNRRIKEVKFKYEEALNFDGHTGPYLQYTCVRLKSIIKKYDKEIIPSDKIESLCDQEYRIIRKLAIFDDIVKLSAEQYEPSVIANYLLELASLINNYYSKVKILDSCNPDTTSMRVLIVYCCFYILLQGLALLGIEVPEKM